MKRVEDYNVITPDNKIWDREKWLSSPNLIDNVSENQYPVMYVEGNPIWEGDEILHMDSNIKKQHMRKVCWQHRIIIISDTNWINSWSFKVMDN